MLILLVLWSVLEYFELLFYILNEDQQHKQRAMIYTESFSDAENVKMFLS